MPHVRSVAAVLALGLATPACLDEATNGTCDCTYEFRLFTLAVIDDASQPVGDLQLTITNLRTGRVLESGWLGLLVPGSYVIADDGMLDEIPHDGDLVRVVGVKAGISFEAEFAFAVREPCRCHVERLAGPDTIVWGEPPPAARD